MIGKLISWFIDNGLLTIPALLMLLLVCGGMTLFGASRLSVGIAAGVIVVVAAVVYLATRNMRFIGG